METSSDLDMCDTMKEPRHGESCSAVLRIQSMYGISVDLSHNNPFITFTPATYVACQKISVTSNMFTWFLMITFDILQWIIRSAAKFGLSWRQC